MSRFVLNSNNQWLVGYSDDTIKVMEGSHSPDLNIHNVQGPVGGWKNKQLARVGTNRHCTHRELEVFGMVISGQKLVELRKNIYNHQVNINREGFMIQWLNPGGGNRSPLTKSLYRRLNDLFDWSKYGVNVPAPVKTEWDRFQLTTGKLMLEGGGGSAQTKKEMEEMQKENEELKKQAKEKDDQLAANKENEKRIQELEKQAKEKDDQLAAKDKQIGNLRAALAAFT